MLGEAVTTIALSLSIATRPALVAAVLSVVLGGVSTVSASSVAVLAPRAGQSLPAAVLTRWTAFQVPDGQTALRYTLGPDGAIWFTVPAAQKIGRITTAGTITEFSAGGEPVDISAGPDGALWFTDVLATTDDIGRLTTDGRLTLYPLHSAYARPVGLVVGADANLYFGQGARIHRMNLHGGEYWYPAVPGMARLGGIAELGIGGDGALWFTGGVGQTRHYLYRMTLGGSLSSYPAGEGAGYRHLVIAGPDGSEWVTGRVDHLERADQSASFGLPAALSSIIAGSDGAFWMTRTSPSGVSQLIRVTIQGVITFRSAAVAEYFGPLQHMLIEGPDGNFWMSGSHGDVLRFKAKLPSALTA
jgi:virginiamycin B lyase